MIELPKFKEEANALQQGRRQGEPPRSTFVFSWLSFSRLKKNHLIPVSQIIKIKHLKN